MHLCFEISIFGILDAMTILIEARLWLACLLFICIFSLILLSVMARTRDWPPLANQRPALSALTNQRPDGYQVCRTPGSMIYKLSRLALGKILLHKHIIMSRSILNTCLLFLLNLIPPTIYFLTSTVFLFMALRLFQHLYKPQGYMLDM